MNDDGINFLQMHLFDEQGQLHVCFNDENGNRKAMKTFIMDRMKG